MKNIRRLVIDILVFQIVLIPAYRISAQDTDNITFHATYGLGEYGFDSHYIGLNEDYARMQIRVYGMLGLNLADVTMNGTAWTQNGLIGVTGTSNGGEFSFNIGLEYGAYAYYGIPVLDLDYKLDLLSLLDASSLDLRLNDSQTFTPFLLDASVMIADNLPAEQVFDIDVTNILFPGIPFVGAGVTLEADLGLQETLSGESIYFSNPGNSIDSEANTLPFSGSSTLLSYNGNATADVIVGIWPGLYVDAFGYRFSFTLIRFPYTLYSSNLPLAFNNCQVNFASSDIHIIDLSLLPSTVNPYSTFEVSGKAKYNTGDLVSDGTAVISIQSGNEYTAAVSNGSFSRYVQAPGNSSTSDITRMVSVTVSDGIVSKGTDSRTLTIRGQGSTSNYDLEVFTVYNYWTGPDGSLCQWCWEDKTVFRTTDDYVGILPYFTDVWINDDIPVESRIYRPSGDQYGSSSYSTLEDPHKYGWDYWIWYVPNWYRWYINNHSMAYNPGQYRAEFYVDGNRKWQQYFTVGWNFTEHHMCKNVEGTEPWGYQDPTNTFSPNDEKAVTWTNFDNVAQGAEIKCEFYAPNDLLYITVDKDTPPGKYRIEDPSDYGYQSWSYYRAWAWIYINGTDAEYKCGDWYAKFYVMNPVSDAWDHYYDDFFRIEESIAPSVSVSAVPGVPIENQNIMLNVLSSDNNHLQKVVLHWNDGSDHTQTWDKIDKSDYNTSHSIGSFATNQLVMYWAEVWDESGNRGESDHHSITVSQEIVSIPNRPSGEKYMKLGQSGTYITGGASSNLEHPVEYQFDWGGEDTSDWSGTNQVHSWNADGVYFVRARARCQLHPNRVSAWSTPFTVILDSADPVVEITTNGGHDLTTSQTQIILAGTAIDPEPSSGLASITINTDDTNDSTLFNWSFSIELSQGTDTLLIVTAMDNAGNSSSDSFIVKIVPVELVTFSAEILENSVKLIWSTATETNNFGFDIEKSNDGRIFMKIGFVEGNMTTSEPQHYVFHDRNLSPGKFYYRLKQIDTDGCFEYTSVLEVEIKLPKNFALYQNYPNPFNSVTAITFTLPTTSYVVLKIYDLLGNEIRTLFNGQGTSGNHNIFWNATDSHNKTVSNGVYLYEMKAGNFSQVKKMLLIR